MPGAMAAMFAAAALLQYNDPDPVRWVLVYGAAAVLSGVAAWRGAVPFPAAGGFRCGFGRERFKRPGPLLT